MPYLRGEADDGQDVGGEGAGLALGLGQPATPTLQGLAYSTILAGRVMAGQLVGLGDGRGDQTQGGDGGAIAGAHRQVARDSQRLGRQRLEAHVAAPAGEETPLSAVDAPGVVGEDRLRAEATPWSAGDDLRVAGGGGQGRVSGG